MAERTKAAERRSGADRRQMDRRAQARRAEDRARKRPPNRDYKVSYRRHIFVQECIRKYGPISIAGIVERWSLESGEIVSNRTVARDIQDLIVYDFARIEYDPRRKGWISTPSDGPEE